VKTRAALATVSERSIQLRKEGAEKLRRKRWPKGHVVTDRRELDETTMYRTPMDDSGHLWERGSIFFRCGRYIEYPHYYSEGWDHLFGVYWVQVDTRKEQGNICAFCKESRTAEAEQAERDAEVEIAARKYNVSPVYPKQHTMNLKPRHLRVWLDNDRLEQLHVG
jgi:hypothetical protein